MFKSPPVTVPFEKLADFEKKAKESKAFMDKLVSKKDEMTSDLLKNSECYVNITKNEEENS